MKITKHLLKVRVYCIFRNDVDKDKRRTTISMDVALEDDLASLLVDELNWDLLWSGGKNTVIIKYSRLHIMEKKKKVYNLWYTWYAIEGLSLILPLPVQPGRACLVARFLEMISHSVHLCCTPVGRGFTVIVADNHGLISLGYVHSGIFFLASQNFI